MKIKVRVLHSYYGCDTGCCGHIIETEDGKPPGRFDFRHPDNTSEDAARDYARQFLIDELGKDHCYDLDWENSEVLYD